MKQVYLSLGSNEGDRRLWLQHALELIAVKCGIVTATSPIYETAAWGLTNQPDFLNMAIGLLTSLSPQQLLATILKIETSLGRHRTVKWGPRTIDIDILLYSREVIATEHLKVPHPLMQERMFILQPLADIAPDATHPMLHKTVTELKAACTDKLEVKSVA